ncbi:6-phosphofructokinase [Marinitoga sp. 1135]|uniref:6-phosphofructokinase n=1 Tax=Marinitoga piezophila (strain DSM 14283 / JCM 11233 / KA3) TaxID=443254 RepID=H2J5U3_MARPK|nr:MULTISPECIES: ATP-dependent 6-phosphofructokinase [Marinitoga]AEX86162.1 6-phosphofructokinase [Marinitoga piezophila KA3]APT76577.1 6-phosphofructokinase [Marinitoga sp. 1137]NUU96344.1 6-phosphofructokinase [Marinitoga sp. 1135]NUU98262.1 6-phosphofructokinase [Marinitoga sp. 1138]
MKRIAVLNVGGDCPGLNSAIRALVRKSAIEDIEVLGVYDGFKGFIEDRVFIMTKEHVSGILERGGTILGSSKFDPTKNPEDFKKLKDNFEKYQITAFVIMSGHTGTSIALKLSEEGMPSVVIPATIDNDLPWTDFSIGFFTALETVTKTLDALHSTASAGHRVIVVEVAGDEAGWLATIGGLTGGADYILIPEIEFNPENLLKNIKKRYDEGKKFSIVVVEEKCPLDEKLKDIKEKLPEGSTPSDIISKYIKEKLPTVECRNVNLGYMQRGGAPVSFDRLIATMFSTAAIEYVKKGKVNVALSLKGFEITDVPFSKELLENKDIEPKIYDMAKIFF